MGRAARLLLACALLAGGGCQRLELPLSAHSARAAPVLGPGAQSHLLFLFRVAPNKARTLYTIPLYFSERRFAAEVVLDTGSALLWLPRALCLDDGRQFCGAEGAAMSYGYLDGRLSGALVAMDVFLGPGPAAARNRDCAVLLASRMDAGVREPILGLGPPPATGAPSFLDRLVANGLVGAAEFTFDLRAQRFFFGAAARPAPAALVIPVDSDSAYAFRVARITFNGAVLAARATTAILDSGNTLVALSAALLPRFRAAAARSGLDCRTRVEQNPNFSELWCRPGAGALSFRVGDGRIAFAGEAFFLGNCGADGLCQTVLEFHRYAGIDSIIGQPLFRLFAVTFSQSARQIRLSRAGSAAAA